LNKNTPVIYWIEYDDGGEYGYAYPLQAL